MSTIAQQIRKRLDAITAADECGYTPDATEVAQVLLEYHGHAAERVLDEARDLIKKWKK